MIADLNDVGIDQVVAALTDLNPREELRRAKMVRIRSSNATEDLWKNHELMYRLLHAGVSLSDTPRVLRALEIAIDLDIAAELVHIPGIRSDPLEPDPLSRSVRDRLSLLYVVGKQYGIQPDYELALTQTSLQDIAGLREHLASTFPPPRIAEFLAIAAATKSAIHAQEVTTLSFSDYAVVAARECRRWGPCNIESPDPWPVPAVTLLRRYAHGFWDEALAEIGLKIPAACRFVEDDFAEALADFNEECVGFDHPMTVEIYDRWVYSEAALRNDRPSAMEVIRHYGSWALALASLGQSAPLAKALPDTAKPTYIDCDSGWGTLEELAEWEAREFEEWRVVENLVAEAIEALPSGSFLHIQYSHTAAPYARATPGSNGVMCEIVSDLGIPSHEWRMSTHWLSDNGWSAPSPENTNWLKEGVPRTEAAAQILLAIQRGRHPVEATELRWNVRTRTE